jgi:hypothetical protein
MRIALRFSLVALLIASMLLPHAVLASARLNEVLPAPGSDWDGDLDADTRKDEWVEIANPGAACDLSDWLLLSGDGKSPVFGFSGTLDPGGSRIVYGSDALDWEAANGHSSIALSLNNGGDVIYLAVVSGGDTAVVDSLRYDSDDVGYDVSLGRVPDGSGAWTYFDHFLPMGGTNLDPTPGAPNGTDPAPHIFAIVRSPLSPTSADTTTITVSAGDASEITRVLLAYDINLEDGEEPDMELISGPADFGTWAYSILPCSEGDTVHYRVTVLDGQSSTVSPWMGYRVRSDQVSIRINEILADPPAEEAGDANRDGERSASDDEFIELVNCGGAPVDISGWVLSDAVSARHEFPGSTMTILPGEFVTVFGGGAPTGFVGKVFTASGGSLGLTNSGDAVRLVDDQGMLVDEHSYGSEGGRDESLIRYPDCSDAWCGASDAGLAVPYTPHAPNDAGAGIPAAGSTWGNIKSIFR